MAGDPPMMTKFREFRFIVFIKAKANFEFSLLNCEFYLPIFANQSIIYEQCGVEIGTYFFALCAESDLCVFGGCYPLPNEIWILLLSDSAYCGTLFLYDFGIFSLQRQSRENDLKSQTSIE